MAQLKLQLKSQNINSFKKWLHRLCCCCCKPKPILNYNEFNDISNNEI